MGVVALVSWVVTALAGATLFGIWVARGGLRREGAGASRFPPALIFGHPILAATGLIIWIIYLATATDGLRWVAVAILLAVATLGFTMAARWRQERAAAQAAAGADRTVLPPEQHFPVPLIGLHGLLAVEQLEAEIHLRQDIEAEHFRPTFLSRLGGGRTGGRSLHLHGRIFTGVRCDGESLRRRFGRVDASVMLPPLRPLGALP